MQKETRMAATAGRMGWFPCEAVTIEIEGRVDCKRECTNSASQAETKSNCYVHGPKLVGVHGSYPRVDGVAGVGGLGGVAHGIFEKSKNSSRFDCAASLAVR